MVESVKSSDTTKAASKPALTRAPATKSATQKTSAKQKTTTASQSKARSGKAGSEKAESGVVESGTPKFLSVRQVANLLHLNEKKVYQLAAEGDIPCTKVTGKWLFPTTLIEHWVHENSHGGVLNDRLFIAGSEDLLLQRICNRFALAQQHAAMVGYSPSGTRHGLKMLETGRVDACFIHWGATQANAVRHLGLLRSYRNHRHWVLLRQIQRSQGLILSPRAHLPGQQVDDLLTDPRIRWSLRVDTAGSTRLLQDECAARHVSLDQLVRTVAADSERSAVSAVSRGLADITCGAYSSAREYNLHFLPLNDVALDLVMHKRTYFRAIMQHFLGSFSGELTRQDCDELGGYTLHTAPTLLTIE